MLSLLALAAVPLAIPADGWVVFTEPAVESTETMGCSGHRRVELAESDRWNGWSHDDELDLAQRFDRVDIYVRYQDGAAEQVRIYTPDCEVVNAGIAKRLELSREDAVQLLDDIATGVDEDLAAAALAAVAHVDTPEVDTRLAKHAADLADEDVSHAALFWLAQRRGDAGRSIVVEHLAPRWPLDHREQAVMMLALSEQPAALEIVRQTAHDAAEADLRAQAVTGLGIVGAPGALADLHSIFMTDDSEEVREQAIFGMAQLDSAEAAATLAAIIRDPRYGEQRRTALFWLAGMQGDGAQQVMDNLVAEIF